MIAMVNKNEEESLDTWGALALVFNVVLKWKRRYVPENWDGKFTKGKMTGFL